MCDILHILLFVQYPKVQQFSNHCTTVLLSVSLMTDHQYQSHHFPVSGHVNTQHVISTVFFRFYCINVAYYIFNAVILLKSFTGHFYSVYIQCYILIYDIFCILWYIASIFCIIVLSIILKRHLFHFIAPVQ